MTALSQNTSAHDRLSALSQEIGAAVLLVNVSIDFEGACLTAVLESLDEIGDQDTLTLLLNSPGGSIEYAFWIAKAIRTQCKQLQVVVPRRAKSAATLLALAADRILMGKFGELGPLDPQLPDPAGGFRRRSPLQTMQGLQYLTIHYGEALDLIMQQLIVKAGMDIPYALEQAQGLLSPIATPLYQNVDFRELGDAYRLLTVGESYAKSVMRQWSKLNGEVIDHIVQSLVWEYPDHSYIIDLEEAQRIGLTNADLLPPHLEASCMEIIFGQAETVTAAPYNDNSGAETNGGGDANPTTEYAENEDSATTDPCPHCASSQEVPGTEAKGSDP